MSEPKECPFCESTDHEPWDCCTGLVDCATDELLDAIGTRDIELTITPVASPEERLREARIAGLKEFWRVNPAVDSYDEHRIIVEVIERVDAEFAKENP